MAADTTPKAGAKEWLGLAVLALPTLLLALDFTVLHLALPHLVADLRPTGSQQLWIVDIYGFMIAGFLITMGTLGDRIGRRRLLMTGAAAFGAASVLAAFSVNAPMLIAARALLGVAGATLMPSTLSLIGNMFRDPRQRGFAVAVWLSCFSAGGVAGPLVGGAVLEWFRWGAVFLLGVPVMLLLLLAGPRLLPEYRDPGGGRIDLIGVALSLATVLPIVFGLKEIAEGGATPWIAIAAGAVSGVLFVRRQRTIADPLMDVRLFRDRAFSLALGGLLAGVATLGAFVLLFAQYLQLVLALPPFEAGLWMAPYAVANIAGALVAPALAARLSAPVAVSGGLVVAAVGYLLFAQVTVGMGPWLAVAASVLVTFGLSPLMVLSIDLVMASAPPERGGAASSMSETAGELGMAFGVATLGALGAAVYRLAVEVPPGTPSHLAEAARDSVAGAVTAAGELPAALVDAVREAFVTGLGVVGYAGAGVVLALAVLVGVVMRR
ncbi:MFS transporter [Sinosporangium siamense]|uniref:MFS transporter n=1 Tax=Sinosporangium siamense TaxID=1367973 RepID=A0A919RGT7_9ACTN|nr:MFS transporter [Sinosporangium siamense]GII91569.1 MFS transporter [Sinosporangium siamense]